jgi:large repetitive protein
VDVAPALTDGVYEFTASITDEAGNESTATGTLTLDTQAPALTADDLLTNNSTPTLTGTSDLIGGTVTVVIDGKTFTAIVDENGKWSVDVAPALTDGVYEFTASITDEAGNESTATGTLTLDTQAPALTADDLLTNNSTPTLTGTSDLIGGTVTVVIDGKTFTAIVDENGKWSVDVAPALTDGVYEFTASITDEAGNESTATGTLTLDTQAPALTADDLLTNNSTPTLTGTSDLIGGTVTVVIDGKTFTAIVDENGKWSVDVAPALTDGVYEFTASITDEAGNESTATGTLTLDTQAPALTADDLLTNNSTPTLTGTSDLIGGTVTVVIDGKTFTAIVDENGKWSVDVAPALTDGVYEFTASITDEAGNESTATGTLTLDTQAPALTADDLLTNNSTPTLTGTSDLIGGTVTVVIDGKTFTAIVDENGKWSVDVAPALTDGVYEFTASITDEAGNESTATGTLTLDTQAPALTADDLLTNNSTPTLTGTSDLIGGTVTVVIDGKTFTAIVDENGKWSVDVAPALTDGVYEFTASITDEAGNESTATGTLTLDTQAPALTADDLLTNNSTPTLTGTSDLIGGTVTVVIDGKTFTAIVDENGKWSVDVAPALTDGVYEFTASITDEAGNESTATGTLTLDTQA